MPKKSYFYKAVKFIAAPAVIAGKITKKAIDVSVDTTCHVGRTIIKSNRRQLLNALEVIDNPAKAAKNLPKNTAKALKKAVKDTSKAASKAVTDTYLASLEVASIPFSVMADTLYEKKGRVVPAVFGNMTDNVRILYMNGVDTTYEQAAEQSEKLSEAFGGQSVTLIHNRTTGSNAADLCIAQDLRNNRAEAMKSEEGRTAYNFIKAQPTDRPLVIYTHSGGNIYMNHVLSLLKEKGYPLEHVHWVSTGSPLNTVETFKLPKENRHFYNDPEDPVYKLAAGAHRPLQEVMCLNMDKHRQTYYFSKFIKKYVPDLLQRLVKNNADNSPKQENVQQPVKAEPKKQQPAEKSKAAEKPAAKAEPKKQQPAEKNKAAEKPAAKAESKKQQPAEKSKAAEKPAAKAEPKKQQPAEKSKAAEKPAAKAEPKKQQPAEKNKAKACYENSKSNDNPKPQESPNTTRGDGSNKAEEKLQHSKSSIEEEEQEKTKASSQNDAGGGGFLPIMIVAGALIAVGSIVYYKHHKRKQEQISMLQKTVDLRVSAALATAALDYQSALHALYNHIYQSDSLLQTFNRFYAPYQPYKKVTAILSSAAGWSSETLQNVITNPNRKLDGAAIAILRHPDEMAVFSYFLAKSPSLLQDVSAWESKISPEIKTELQRTTQSLQKATADYKRQIPSRQQVQLIAFLVIALQSAKRGYESRYKAASSLHIFNPRFEPYQVYRSLLNIVESNPQWAHIKSIVEESDIKEIAFTLSSTSVEAIRPLCQTLYEHKVKLKEIQSRASVFDNEERAIFTEACQALTLALDQSVNSSQSELLLRILTYSISLYKLLQNAYETETRGQSLYSQWTNDHRYYKYYRALHYLLFGNLIDRGVLPASEKNAMLALNSPDEIEAYLVNMHAHKILFWGTALLSRRDGINYILRLINPASSSEAQTENDLNHNTIVEQTKLLAELVTAHDLEVLNYIYPNESDLDSRADSQPAVSEEPTRQSHDLS